MGKLLWTLLVPLDLCIQHLQSLTRLQSNEIGNNPNTANWTLLLKAIPWTKYIHLLQLTTAMWTSTWYLFCMASKSDAETCNSTRSPNYDARLQTLQFGIQLTTWPQLWYIRQHQQQTKANETASQNRLAARWKACSTQILRHHITSPPSKKKWDQKKYNLTEINNHKDHKSIDIIQLQLKINLITLYSQNYGRNHLHSTTGKLKQQEFVQMERKIKLLREKIWQWKK
jgi:hypothetical protein